MAEPPVKLVHDPRPKVAAFIARFDDGPDPVPDALSFLAHTRTLIEFARAQERYPVANLYCNWVLHNAIEGSVAGYELLARVNSLFCGFLRGEGPPTEAFLGLPRLLSQALSTMQLHRELDELYAEMSIVAPSLGYTLRWKVLRDRILYAVAGKPIAFSPRSDVSNTNVATSKRLYEAAKAEMLACNGGVDATIVQILLLGSGLPFHSGDVARDLVWHVRLAKGASLSGPLVLDLID